MGEIPEQIARFPQRELIQVPEGVAFTLSTNGETMLVELLGISSPDLETPITHVFISPEWKVANDPGETNPFLGPYAFIDRPGVYEFIVYGVFNPALAVTAIFDIAVTRGLSERQFGELFRGTGSHSVFFRDINIPALTEVTLGSTLHPIFPTFRTLAVQNQGDSTLSIRLTQPDGSTCDFFLGNAAAANFRSHDATLLGRSTVTLFANDTLGNTDVTIGVSLW